MYSYSYTPPPEKNFYLLPNNRRRRNFRCGSQTRNFHISTKTRKSPSYLSATIDIINRMHAIIIIIVVIVNSTNSYITNLLE